MLEFTVLALSLVVTTSTTEAENLLVTWDQDNYEYITGSESQCASPELQTLTIEIGSDSDTPTIVETNELFVWWVASSSTDCTEPEDEDSEIVVKELALNDINSAAPPLTSTTSPLSFPGDLPDQTFTLDSLLSRANVDICTEGETLDHQEFKLCFAINTITVTTGLNGLPTEEDPVRIDELTEPHGSVVFIIDNVAPVQPTIDQVVAKDGTLELTASVSPSDDHISTWHVYLRETDSAETTDTTTDAERETTDETTTETTDGATTDETDDTTTDSTTDETTDSTTDTDCTSWGVEALTYDASTETPSTLSMDVAVSNGISYDLCVVAVDAAGNTSEPSEVTTQTAQDECDFIECYPGELNDGHCGAAPGALWWLLALGFFTRSRKRGALA